MPHFKFVPGPDWCYFWILQRTTPRGFSHCARPAAPKDARSFPPHSFKAECRKGTSPCYKDRPGKERHLAIGNSFRECWETLCRAAAPHPSPSPSRSLHFQTRSLLQIQAEGKHFSPSIFMILRGSSRTQAVPSKEPCIPETPTSFRSVNPNTLLGKEAAVGNSFATEVERLQTDYHRYWLKSKQL